MRRCRVYRKSTLNSILYCIQKFILIASVIDNTENNNKQGQQTSRKPKLTFNERKEMASLEADIEALEAEKKMIEEKLSSGKISVDEITELSRRLPKLNEELDVKSMRWLELSEIEG